MIIQFEGFNQGYQNFANNAYKYWTRINYYNYSLDIDRINFGNWKPIKHPRIFPSSLIDLYISHYFAGSRECLAIPAIKHPLTAVKIANNN
uniref:Uncharacterized protein n=1 Tax=Cyanothece sp. (strain PCC 7425 / ATCC 29141) TaxID=395961 RepID=B8HUJ2_CYAP4